jgi:hypothetical protein
VTKNDDIGEEIESSDKEFMSTAELDFMLHTRQPKDHFVKILEVACPHHTYHVKHKLKDCTMMKRFIASGALPSGDEPARESRGRGTTLIFMKVEVMTIIS